MFSFNHPHHACFHLSWMGSFVSFVSTFAAAPMAAIIREDLEMTKPDLSNAGLAAVTGTIIARIIMGSVCDVVGSRYGLSIVLLLSAPFCFCMSYVTTAGGFLICSCGIGLGLATFVACLYWMSVMFNGKVVGIANATAAGWGNLGGGVTQFMMPVIYKGMVSATGGRIFSAWRWAYLVPGLLHTVTSVMVIFLGQDLPDGNYQMLHASDRLEKKSMWQTQWIGIRNYRMWCMVATYGFCFGVELTMNNIVAGYNTCTISLNSTSSPRHHRLLLWPDEPLRTLNRRHRVGQDVGHIRYARPPLDALAGADHRGCALHPHGARQGLARAYHLLHDFLLHLRASLRGRVLRHRALPDPPRPRRRLRLHRRRWQRRLHHLHGSLLHLRLHRDHRRHRVHGLRHH